MNVTQSSQSQKTIGEFDFDFESGNFFDKDLVNEYSDLIGSTQPQQHVSDENIAAGIRKDGDGDAVANKESLTQSDVRQYNQKAHSVDTGAVNLFRNENDQPCGSESDALERPLTSRSNQREKFVDLSSVDPGQGFRMSNWIRGDGTVNYEDDLHDRQPNNPPVNKRQKVRPMQTYNYPGFRTANVVNQERQISEDEDKEDEEPNNQGSVMSRYLARQYKKANLGYAKHKSRTGEMQAFSENVAKDDSDEEDEEECTEDERMRRKVRMYDENYDSSTDFLRAYNKLMYKKASLPVNLVASSFYRSSISSTTKNRTFLNSSYQKLSKTNLKREPLTASLGIGNIQPIALKQESDSVENQDSSTTVMPTTVKQESNN